MTDSEADLIQAGDRIKTPFGTARVLAIDLAMDLIKTTHGDWAWDQLYLVEPPGPGAGPDEWEEYLSEPTNELRGATDVENVPCRCDCTENCSTRVSRAKNSGVTISHYHEATTSCRCRDAECPCVL